ncbi:uncharacterized protein V6R79_007161 [Siganus canaliculatus]
MDSLRRRESVCRRLFGQVDHEQLHRDLKQRMKEIAEEDSRRWNFNFQTDTPLPGRFQWEEVPADSAAGLYHESAQAKDSVCSDEVSLNCNEENTGTDQENCSSISNTLKRNAEVTPVRRKRTLSKSAEKSRKNTRITDFFAKRRRTTETKSILNTFHTSSSETAQCKTIR